MSLPPSWIPASRRIFGASSLSDACLEYSDTNEDIDLTLKTLDVQPGHVVVGVTANADLLLSALRYDPAFVAGFDLNPAQNALAELKRTAIHSLDYHDYLVLLGYRTHPRRRKIFESLLPSLPPLVRDFWTREDMTQAVNEGLWRQGTATRKDLEQWQRHLLQLGRFLGPQTMNVVLGLAGSRHDREQIRSHVAQVFPRYAHSLHHPHRPSPFNPFSFPNGIINYPACSKYAWGLVPEEHIYPPLSRKDFERIRPNLHRACFITSSMLDALSTMPNNAFHRMYLSNITEYFSISEERALVEALLDKACFGAVVVLLFIALSPGQRRDLLDHDSWSDRGWNRLFFGTRRWSDMHNDFKDFVVRGSDFFPRWARELRQKQSRERIVTQAKNRLVDSWRRFSTADYAEAGRSSLSSAHFLLKHAQDRWEEASQLSHPDYVLIENEARTAAFYSDLFANLRASHAHRSFYPFDYAILHKVRRHGATYELPELTTSV